MATENPIEILKEATTTGCKFISFLYLTKGTGETSRYTLNFGIDYKAACEADKNALVDYQPQTDLEIQAKAEMLASLTQTLTKGVSDSYTHSAKNKANGQDTYQNVSRGIKLHKESGAIHLSGYVQQKEQVAPPTKPKKPVNHGPLKLAKKHIEKACGFKHHKIREFILLPENIAGIKVNGDLIQLHD